MTDENLASGFRFAVTSGLQVEGNALVIASKITEIRVGRRTCVYRVLDELAEKRTKLNRAAACLPKPSVNFILERDWLGHWNTIRSEETGTRFVAVGSVYWFTKLNRAAACSAKPSVNFILQYDWLGYWNTIRSGETGTRFVAVGSLVVAPSSLDRFFAIGASILLRAFVKASAYASWTDTARMRMMLARIFSEGKAWRAISSKGDAAKGRRDAKLPDPVYDGTRRPRVIKSRAEPRVMAQAWHFVVRAVLPPPIAAPADKEPGILSGTGLKENKVAKTETRQLERRRVKSLAYVAAGEWCNRSLTSTSVRRPVVSRRKETEREKPLSARRSEVFSLAGDDRAKGLMNRRYSKGETWWGAF
ncbi:hypothetical protein B0H16DRAFT_1458549 [Mycena metata]|uniref:Uncharacterized protein n=1 Tax=Mycena metata TaxID=1033252 RepID=A0AAD7J235_9AGAR|nr:hypothetical protein B0H16DRAFT_1458549 [Mycena metata]